MQIRMSKKITQPYPKPEKPEPPKEYITHQEILSRVTDDHDLWDSPNWKTQTSPKIYLDEIPAGTEYITFGEKYLGGEFGGTLPQIIFCRDYEVENDKYQDQLDDYERYILPDYECELASWEENERKIIEEGELDKLDEKEWRRKQYEKLKEEFGNV